MTRRAASTGVRLLAAMTVVGVSVLVATGQALAAGPAVNVGTPGSSEGPSVSADSAGNALVAWVNTSVGSNNSVQYCVLPLGASTCSHADTLHPAGGAQFTDAVQVLDENGTLVILADVFGTQNNDENYLPIQEWQSTDGGATFVLQSSGTAVADGIIGADTVPLNGVAVPGSNELGFGWETAQGPPTFDAFPGTANAPECSRQTCPAGEAYATLEPSTNPDQVTNGGGQFASETGVNAGVLGVFDTLFTSGPFGCANAFGTAFVYGSGLQSPSNSYDISPGTADTAWRTAVTQLDCGVEYPAAGGGPSGFGVLESDDANGTTIYHRFDQTTDSFDTAPVTVSAHSEQQPSVSQDGAGGVYATYLSTGVGGPLSLSYSHDGGATWSGPATVNANSDGGVSHLTSQVNAAGQGWAAWVDNGSVFAQSFNAQDSVTPPAPTTLATSQTAGAVTGSSISVPAGTSGDSDRATISGANAMGATGTVKYTLYSGASCSASSIVSQSSAPVTGGIAGASAPITQLLAPGGYYWVASYSGDAGSVDGAVGNQPSASGCGSEKLTVGAPNTVSSSGTSDGKTVTVTVNCATFPCTITLTLTASETVTVKASIARKKTRRRTVTLGTATFTLKKKGSKKVAIKLSKTGRRFLSSKHGSVKLNLTDSEKFAHGGKVVSKHTVRIRLIKAKKKK